MNTFRVIALVIVSVTLSVLAGLLFLNSPAPTTQSIEEVADKVLDLENKKSAATYVNSNKPKEATQEFKPEHAESSNNRYTGLLDEAAINTLFVNEQGAVNSSAMTHVLTVGMADFIEQASSSQTNSELAINRQEKLSQQLFALKGLVIYDQHTVCSGRICALSLSTNKLTEKNRKLISEFDTNISFVNTSVNTTGEVEFKAIYLHTEDPSQLVMTQP
ncbi:hypothetical protein [Shewanella atlantica]|uniref:hypothetical protein n=1 Tax=Shewanella atlantica TaxID=271099 RepID=UPI003736E235